MPDNGPKRDVSPAPNTFEKKNVGESFNEAAHPWNNPGKTGGSDDPSYNECDSFESYDDGDE